MKSIWELSLKNSDHSDKEHKSLSRDIDRDIVVIGGGLAGILTAYNLTKSGLKVTLIEADRLYSGVTSKTTAHISSQQGYLYYDLTKKKSLEWASLYYESQQQGIYNYKNLIERENIDCDFQMVKDYLYTTKNLEKLRKLYEILNKINAKVKFYENKEVFGVKVPGIIETQNQAIFNPLKFLSQLKKDFEIFEKTRILDIDMKHKILYTKDHKIHANKIIIATNYPIVKIKGAYFIKLYKSHSYCAVTEKVKEINGTYQSDEDNGLTFRNYNNQIIIGGLDHRTGRINSNTKKQRMEEIAGKYFNTKIINFWDANDVVTYDGLPIVGKFSKKYKDVYIITGFNKRGMANSIVSSILITDLIIGKENKFKNIFSPQRFNFCLKGFLSNLGSSLNNLIIKPLTPVFKSYKNLRVGNGEIMNYKGSKKAVYLDEFNKIHICSPYCKHLGCQLKFNKNTKTWDCPCHGSRYDIDGNIITAPTVGTLEKTKEQ